MVSQFQQANQLQRSGKLEEAVIAYRSAIASNPDFYWSYHNLGETLTQLGRLDEAVEAYQKAVELNPEGACSHLSLAELLEQQGKEEEASTSYQKAIELKPALNEVKDSSAKLSSVVDRSSYLVKGAGGSTLETAVPATISAMLQRSQEKIQQFHNKHLGDRCVIIGNGPSLNQMDLSFLKHEICFGTNKIFMGFERWNFSPTYYVAVNPFVIEQSVDEIRKISCPKFIGNQGIYYFSPADDLIFVKTSPPPGEHFSKRPDLGVNEGCTVTYVALQLAYYMGFSEVILIGVDHHFATQGTPHKTVVSDGDDPNHFDPCYFSKGLKWQLPDLVNSEKSYQVAKQVFEESGRKIIDATVNGRCPVFPKKNYRLIFDIVSDQLVKERQSENLARRNLYNAALNAYKGALTTSSISEVLHEHFDNQISLISKSIENDNNAVTEKNIILTACNSKYFSSLLLFLESLLQTNEDIVDHILIFDFGLEPWQVEIVDRIYNAHIFRQTEESLVSYPPYKRFKLDDPATYFFKVYGFHEGINYCRQLLGYKSFNLLWCDSGIKIQYSLNQVFSIIDNEFCFFVDHSDVNLYYKGSVNNLATILSPKLFKGSLQLPIPTEEQLQTPYIKANFFGFKIGSKYDIMIGLHRDLCCLTDILFDPREITEKAARTYWQSLYGNNPNLTYRLGRHEQAVWSYLVALCHIEIRQSSPFNFTIAAGSGTIDVNTYQSRMRRILEPSFTQFRDSMKRFVVEYDDDEVSPSDLNNNSVLLDKYLALSKMVYLEQKLYQGIRFPASEQSKSSLVLLHRGSLAKNDQYKYAGRLLNHNTNLKDDIFILLGNGPSLAEVDLHSLSNFDTFGMNAAYRAYDRINFWPKYLGCFDALVCGHHSNNFKKLIRDSPIEQFFFINFNDKGDAIFVEPDILSSPKFQKIRFQHRTPEEKTRTDILSVSFEQFIDMRTSGPNVIQVGLLLGYRKFIMLGVDQNYKEVVDGAKKDKHFHKLVMEKTPNRNPNYWFDDYQQKGDKFNRPNLTQSQMPSWNNLSQTLECLEIKAEIYNCSPITQLECFKKASLSFAINKLSNIKIDQLTPYRSPLGNHQKQHHDLL
ncbi:MAG: tetratricopeptide repeat protein [Microcoleaceae cyanobacterium]